MLGCRRRPSVGESVSSLSRDLSLPSWSLFPPPLNFGHTGVVYRLNDRVVVKIFFDSSEEEARREVELYSLISEQKHLSPYIVQCFFHTPQLLFLDNMKGGTLDARLRRNQISETRPIRVKMLEEPQLILRWALQLSEGIAWLEALGHVHGDIRPPNLLLDDRDHIRIADLGWAAALGEEIEVGHAPYARVLGREAGAAAGQFGVFGAHSEQFAIGSILYYMSRGYELYDDQDFGVDHGCEVVDRLQRKEFPPLKTTCSHTDSIIDKCWDGDFPSIRHLSEAVKAIPGASAIELRHCEVRDEAEAIRAWCQIAIQSTEIERIVSLITKMQSNGQRV